MASTPLPIDPVLADIQAALADHRQAVLVAPPGAGKTTRVPLALLSAPWLAGRRIVMLEPRRLAARVAARFMAASLGEAVGETVGHRVRLDTRVGPKTRLEVVTEGVLTRMLQTDPALDGVGLVIFDEFHERSLQADLGLALCLQSRAILRSDLRILVMSATLAATPVAELLDGAPVIAGSGRSYPVETRFLPRRVESRLEPAVVRAIVTALAESQGDLLVFLPGAGEIRRVEQRLGDLDLGTQVRITPLHGNLPMAAQDQAIAPPPPGQRKVVLATAIAETSLTVAGVQVVIDSGLMRVPRFSPRTGMTRLETVTVSRAAADQRRGRAGRLGPGICHRLWTEDEDRRLTAQSKPEMLEADLAPLVLELAVWGVIDPGELRWLDPPPTGAVTQARDLLLQLGALSDSGAVTAHGRQMAELGVHPRLAHMIRRALVLGQGSLACELAALLSERDIFRGGFRGEECADADLRRRVAELRHPGAGSGGAGAVDPAAVRRVQETARQWQRNLGPAAEGRGAGAPGSAGANVMAGGVDDCGLLLAFAYPDRIAQRRADGLFLLRNGRGAAFARVQVLGESSYLVAADLDDQGTESRIYLAAPVTLAELEQHLGDQIADEAVVAWDATAQAVRARRRRRLGALVLKDDPLPDPDPAAVAAALLQGIVATGTDILPWTPAAHQWQHRVLFLRQWAPDYPDVSDVALTATLANWLEPHLHGLRTRSDLQRLNLGQILDGLLSRSQHRELGEHAPTHIAVPSGSRLAIDYSDPAAPFLAVRLQEMFGLAETPRIAGGRVPLTLHLLSPAHRPVQVTRDLAGFWRTTYFAVRKDLRGRYPKHFWPDDPLQAPPTRRTRPPTPGKEV